MRRFILYNRGMVDPFFFKKSNCVIFKVYLLIFFVCLFCFNVVFASPASISTAVTSVVTTNHGVFPTDHSDLWSAAPDYVWPFAADTWYAFTGAPDLFTADQIKNVFLKFVEGRSMNGDLPIYIDATNIPFVYGYYSAWDTNETHATGDGAFFIPMMEKLYYDKTCASSFCNISSFNSTETYLKTALSRVQRDPVTKLVNVDINDEWVPWGFQDAVRQTGNVLMGSLLYYKASLDMAALYTANGDTTNATFFTNEADDIKSNISTLWDGTDGMFYAATGRCHQIDIEGSSYAVYLGITTTEQATDISNYLVANYSTLTLNGFIRQSPQNWEFSYAIGSRNGGGQAPGAYDDGYWSVANEWVATALKVTSPSTAVQFITDFSNNSDMTMEFHGSGSSGNMGFTSNLESPMGAYKFYSDYSSIFPDTDPGSTPTSVGLLAHYKMNDTNGTIVVDSKNNHNAVGNYTANPTGGLVNGSLIFNGSSDIATIPFSSIGHNNAISVSAWIKTTTSGIGLNIGNYGADVGFRLITIGSLGVFQISQSGGAADYNATIDNSNLNNGSWHHLVGTWDGTTVQIYQDDVLSPVTAVTTGLSFNDDSVPVTIGTSGLGEYDDIRIYNGALVQGDVDTLWNNGLGTEDEPVVNNPPSVTFDNNFSTWNHGNVTVDYNLIDTEGDTSNISQTASLGIQYSTDNSTWHNATMGTGGDGLTGLTSSVSPGENHTFIWNSVADLPNTESSTVRIRIRPNDGTSSANAWASSNAFGIDNRAPSFGTDVTSGLLVHYKMNDTNGTTVADNTANHYTATGTYTSDPTGGKINGALSFNGTSNYVTIPTLGSQSAISVSAWVKNTADGVGVTIGNLGDLGGIYHYRLITIGNLGLFQIRSAGGVDNNATLTFAKDGSWHHLVGTYDGTTVKIYQDGVISETTASISGIVLDNSIPYIGVTEHLTTFGASEYDDVRIYSRALDQSEIDTIWNNGIGTEGVSSPVITFGTVSSSSIVVNEPTGATDSGSGIATSPYYLDRNSGEFNSGWQTSNIFTDTGLTANTQYTYKFKVKDVVDNVSDFLGTVSKYTLAPVSTNFYAIPNKKDITLSVDSFPNDTASSSGYYFSRSDGINSGWIQTNTWQDTGLSCNTSYTYSVKYRNSDGIETEPIFLNQKTSSCDRTSSRRINILNQDVNTTDTVVTNQSPSSQSPTPVVEQSSTTSKVVIPIVVPNNNVVIVSSTFLPSISLTAYLKLGNKGTEVTKLQNFLINKGYSLPSGVTSYFGNETQSALSKYQTDKNIAPTGTLGPITRDYINKNLANTTVTPLSTSTTTKYIFNNNLKLNSVS